MHPNDYDVSGGMRKKKHRIDNHLQFAYDEVGRAGSQGALTGSQARPSFPWNAEVVSDGGFGKFLLHGTHVGFNTDCCLCRLFAPRFEPNWNCWSRVA